MSVPAPLNLNIPNVQRPTRNFTPHTRFHNPHLDPNVPKENLRLVPPSLFAGRKLNRELPGSAATNLHVMLKLTDEPNELQKEFIDKIPQINDILGLWGEVKGASPTTTVEAQPRSRVPIAEECSGTSTEESKGTTFNLVSNLDSPGRADVIYVADASEDSGEHAEDTSTPPNLRTVEWLGFDGSYVHLEDAEPKMAVAPTEQDIDFHERSIRANSTPSNLRITEWLDDEEQTDFPNEPHYWESASDAGASAKEVGPYEAFWINHDSIPR